MKFKIRSYCPVPSAIKFWNTQPLWGAFLQCFLLVSAESHHLPYFMYWMWYILRCFPHLQTEYKSQVIMVLFLTNFPYISWFYMLGFGFGFFCLGQGVCVCLLFGGWGFFPCYSIFSVLVIRARYAKKPQQTSHFYKPFIITNKGAGQ